MEKTETARGERVTERVWRCPDGVYRWYYEYSMMKNPVILYTVWRVIGMSLAIVFLIMWAAPRDGYERSRKFTEKLLADDEQ